MCLTCAVSNVTRVKEERVASRNRKEGVFSVLPPNLTRFFKPSSSVSALTDRVTACAIDSRNQYIFVFLFLFKDQIQQLSKEVLVLCFVYGAELIRKRISDKSLFFLNLFELLLEDLDAFLLGIENTGDCWLSWRSSSCWNSWSGVI